jgi:hypothetical protein
LTDWTTCINEMAKKTTCEKYCKKNHSWVAARLARRHVAHVAWAKAGKGVPPLPTPACQLSGDAVDRR